MHAGRSYSTDRSSSLIEHLIPESGPTSTGILDHEYLYISPSPCRIVLLCTSEPEHNHSNTNTTLLTEVWHSTTGTSVNSRFPKNWASIRTSLSCLYIPAEADLPLDCGFSMYATGLFTHPRFLRTTVRIHLDATVRDGDLSIRDMREFGDS
ncbi:hypothetical protein EDD18DRAFT_760164 [Armillaria luteobubalina]|uniref:Uncharacterized protein n=1 Tax=Armillaria luteobubalina TaxID=153913 RepID=A0AA39PFK4_9AGAR|nr:hypothetical protein EDD18DRAFT_760164 [Armillaria luteobubalina]